jgi:hypothetical protein
MSQFAWHVRNLRVSRPLLPAPIQGLCVCACVYVCMCVLCVSVCVLLPRVCARACVQMCVDALRTEDGMGVFLLLVYQMFLYVSLFYLFSSNVFSFLRCYTPAAICRCSNPCVIHVFSFLRCCHLSLFKSLCHTCFLIFSAAAIYRCSNPCVIHIFSFPRCYSPAAAVSLSHTHFLISPLLHSCCRLPLFKFQVCTCFFEELGIV